MDESLPGAIQTLHHGAAWLAGQITDATDPAHRAMLTALHCAATDQIAALQAIPGTRIEGIAHDLAGTLLDPAHLLAAAARPMHQRYGYVAVLVHCVPAARALAAHFPILKGVSDADPPNLR